MSLQKTSMGARDKGLAYNAGGLNIKKKNECEVNVMHGREINVMHGR